VARLTLRHLAIFVAVCEENSVTRAARRLRMAQPAASLAVKELEAYYDVRLFDRISRRLYLTDAGRKLLEYATHIVALFEDMENGIRQWELSARLRVGASITIGTKLIPRYVNAFLREEPGSAVEVFIGSSDQIERKILQNELDFALMEGQIHSDQLTQTPYAKDRLAVICAPENPLASLRTVTAQQLLAQPLLLREPGSGTRELFDHVLSSREYAYRPAWESTSTEALVQAVKAGLGVSVLPWMLVGEELASGGVAELKVKGLRFERGFHMVYHKNKFLTRHARRFMDICRAQTGGGGGGAQ
jgi:DNA-binding transcriptional LysR family regulator